MNLIDKIPFAHFKALTFRNEQLWKSYEQLNGFISKNFDNQFNDVLAKPFAADNGINWYSVREGEFKPLDNFSVAEKQTLLLRYHYLLNQVNAKVSELKLSSNQDNHIWADLLSLSFAPANNILYFKVPDYFECKVRIMAITGEILEQLDVTPTRTSSPLNLVNGVYLLQVETSEGTYFTHRLVVER